MRELITKDIFTMSKILKKIDLKDSIKVEDKTQEQMGAELILAIGENLYLAQDEVNQLLGDLVGITGEEFGNLPISESLKYIDEFKKLPGITDFFKQATRLMK